MTPTERMILANQALIMGALRALLIAEATDGTQWTEAMLPLIERLGDAMGQLDELPEFPPL